MAATIGSRQKGGSGRRVFAGMIMWPKAKRAVSDSTARQIASIARDHDALAVGVFVDENAETITQRCAQDALSLRPGRSRSRSTTSRPERHRVA